MAMRSLIAAALTVLMMMLEACDRSPLGNAAPYEETFEEFVAGLEQNTRAGVTTDWTKAEERFATYTASLSTASARLTEAEKEKQDELVGRWWAARVKGMSIQEACAFLKRQGRRAESFLEEIQR